MAGDSSFLGNLAETGKREIVESKVTKMAEILKVLANENRLTIFCVLMETPLTVSELAGHLPGITQSALSQHLSILKAHGILNSSKSGQKVTYFIADEKIAEVIRVMKKYYCEP